MDPTFRQLEYAVAVADHRHFRRAAEACHVTQPALSTQIQQLESTLGVQLFERGRRGVLVTPEGEQILARARGCLQGVRDLTDTAAQLRRPGAGALRFGLIPTIAPYLLPHLVPRLRSAYPDAELQLWEEQTEVLLARLRRGEVDLLLLALPLHGDDLVCQALADEPFVLLAPAEHPLSDLPHLLQADLEDAPVLLLEDGHCLRDQALDICETAGARATHQVHANSLATLVQMVANGLGVTLLPATAIPVEARAASGLVLRWFEEPRPSRSIGLVWRNGAAREKDYQALAEVFQQEISIRLEDVEPERT